MYKNISYVSFRVVSLGSEQEEHKVLRTDKEVNALHQSLEDKFFHTGFVLPKPPIKYKGVLLLTRYNKIGLASANNSSRNLMH